MTVSNTDFDIAVIGASLGGAITALEAGQSGAKIVIFDKENFPRKKVCGEGLSTLGKSLLQEIGVTPPLQPLTGYRVWNGKSSLLLSGRKEDAGFGVERFILDNQFLNKVCSTSRSITPITGTKIRDIEELRDSVKINCSVGSITAKKLVIADGAKSLVSHRLEIPTTRKTNLLYGVSLSCKTDISLDSVQLFVQEGYEAYLTPVSPGRLNLSFLGFQKPLSKLAKFDALIQELHQIEELIGQRIEPEESLRGVGPIAPITRPSTWHNALLVGDACESLDPLSGMGMTHALLSGQLAGELLREYFEAKIAWENLVKDYSVRQQKISKRLRGYSRTAHVLVRHLSSSPIFKLSQKAGLPEMFRNAALSSNSNIPGEILSLIGTQFH